MLDISQVTSLLQSLGVSKSVANKAVQRTAQSSNVDAQSFLEELQQTLKELSANTSQKITSKSEKPQSIEFKTVVSDSSEKKSAEYINSFGQNIEVPFGNFKEFCTWEKKLGNTFAKNYKTPDYIRVLGLSLGGGDADAFKRFLFFKNNPQYAIDYESIRGGNLSSFPTDGSTLIKSDLSKIDKNTADFYKENPSQLRAAEGFNMDPTLLKKRMEGNSEGMGDPDWLTGHRWTPEGVVENNNRVFYAQAKFIGLDGKGEENYRLAKYDLATGRIVDLDGRTYDPLTGEA